MTRRARSPLRGAFLLGLLVATLTAAESQNREAPPGSAPAPDLFKEGGPDCASATVVDVGPSMLFRDTDDSCGAPTVVSDYRNGTCNTVQYPGPELIYQITLSSNTQLFYTLTPTTADMGLFMVSDCAAPNSCVDFHDAIGAGAPSELPRLHAGSLAAGTYYLYVDSYYASGSGSCGDYTLLVRGIPVELMRFTID